LINQLRAFLLVRGITQGRRKLERHVETLLFAKEVSFSRRSRVLIEDQQVEWRELDPVLAAPMPHKLNADRRHHIPKISFKVQNRAKYETRLRRRRGSLTCGSRMLR
jgi:hypothetical protein